jgi:hypothetical protein
MEHREPCRWNGTPVVIIEPMRKRKYKTAAEKQRAYRFRHGQVKLIRLSVIDDLYQDIIHRKAKLAAKQLSSPDLALAVLELLNHVERKLTALRPIAKP